MTDFNYDDAYEKAWNDEHVIGDRFRLYWGIHDLINNPHKKIARNREDRDKMTEEEWDLGLYEKTIEVKILKTKFGHNPASFPHKNAFIMTKSSWDKVIKKPILVILVSKETGCMLGVDTVATGGPDGGIWTVSKYWWDNDRGHPDRCYQLPKEYLLNEEQIVEKLQSIRPCMAPTAI